MHNTKTFSTQVLVDLGIINLAKALNKERQGIANTTNRLQNVIPNILQLIVEHVVATERTVNWLLFSTILKEDVWLHWLEDIFGGR